jgi:hypothetical protein
VSPDWAQSRVSFSIPSPGSQAVDEHDLGEVELDVEVVIAERVVLRRVEHLEQRDRRIAAPVGADLSGMGLDGTTSVTFGTVMSHSVRVDPNGLWVRAVVPTGVPAGSINITLDNGGNPVSFGPFQILAGSVPAAANPAPGANVPGGVRVTPKLAPRISQFSPTAGAVGTRMLINGAHLDGELWLSSAASERTSCRRTAGRSTRASRRRPTPGRSRCTPRAARR